MAGRWTILLGSLLLAVAPALAGCKRKSETFGDVKRSADDGAKVQIGVRPTTSPLVAAQYRFRLAIYTTTPPTIDVARELRSADDKGTFVALREGEPAPMDTARSRVVVSFPPVEKLPPPEASSLQYYAVDLSAEDEQKLLKSGAVTALVFEGAGTRALAEYRVALELAQGLASKLGGYLWDDESRNVFTIASGAKRLTGWNDGLPEASRHVTLHVYQSGELMRVVTLGMKKFALPDIAVNNVSPSDTRSMGNLVNLVCQSLLERGKLDRPGMLEASLDRLRDPEAKQDLSANLKPNAKRSVVVDLAEAKAQEGDADNRLLDIVFPGSVRELQERQTAALAAVYGVEDGVTHVNHDQELLETSARARVKALALKSRFANGRPFGEQLSVKAPFATPSGGTEWMWVEVTSWQGKTIHGILDNEPFEIPSLKAGARVDVPEDKIFDYLLTRNDGTSEGNETSVIIERRSKQTP